MWGSDWVMEEQGQYKTARDDVLERPASDERADMIVLFLEQRRRALILELREVESLLGWPQSIPQRTRTR